MKIAFVGDIHGRVFHTLAVLATLQQKTDHQLDMIIQVGDLGAYPFPTQEMRNAKFILDDPTELDFSKLIHAKGKLLDNLYLLKEELHTPIYFIRGNHEDFNWLNKISKRNITSVDKTGFFSYVVDGTTMKINDYHISFLGGIETEQEDETSINEEVYDKLLHSPVGELDILVTHDAPYGIGTSFTGQVQGSRKISTLIEKIKPKYLISGHYHHLNGPKVYSETTYLGLNILVPPLRRDRSRKVQSDSIAILDTSLNTIEVLQEEWVSQFSTINFDFNQFVQQFKANLL